MKRILVFIAAVVFILSVFVSCDSSSDESQGGGSAPSTDRSVPLTLEFLSDGKLSFSTPPSSLRYSTDGGETKLAYTGEIDVSEGTSAYLQIVQSGRISGSTVLRTAMYMAM